MQVKSISHPKDDNRVMEFKSKVVSQPHEICIERAKLFTESYKKTKGERHMFQKITFDLVENLSSAKTYIRGEDYYESGAVRKIKYHENTDISFYPLYIVYGR